MTLCPSAPPPPPPLPTLSSNASAAQVVFVAVPRATRTMQRFVMGEKYFTLFSVNKKGKRSKHWGKRRRRKRNISPASDAPTSPQPTSPKFNSTLCFSALKTSFPDIASGDVVVMCWIWPCPGVETDVDDGDGDAAGMNSMRSQRFCLRACSIAEGRYTVGRDKHTLNRTMHG
jgi:hypothetical protein